MLSDAVELARCFDKPPLAGRPVDEVAVPTSGEAIFAIELEHGEYLPGWEQARAAFEQTGRAPVLIGDWGEKHFLRGAVRVDSDPRVILDHAARIDADAAIESISRDRMGRYSPEMLRYDLIYAPYENWLDWHLERTEKQLGVSPTPEEVRSKLPAGATSGELDRWLLTWEETHRPGIAQFGGRYLNWYEPRGGVAYLALPPCAASADALAYFPFYAEMGMQASELGGAAALLIAILRSWTDRYEAELVSHWHTMLNLLVRRPPTDLVDAFALAREQELISGNTLSGASLRDHARVLVGRDRWFLHDRP